MSGDDGDTPTDYEEWLANREPDEPDEETLRELDPEVNDPTEDGVPAAAKQREERMSQHGQQKRPEKPKWKQAPSETGNDCPHCQDVWDKDELDAEDSKGKYGGVGRTYFCPNCEKKVRSELVKEPSPAPTKKPDGTLSQTY